MLMSSRAMDLNAALQPPPPCSLCPALLTPGSSQTPLPKTHQSPAVKLPNNNNNNNQGMARGLEHRHGGMAGRPTRWRVRRAVLAAAHDPAFCSQQPIDCQLAMVNKTTNTHLPPRPHVVHCFPPHICIVPWRAWGRSRDGSRFRVQPAQSCLQMRLESCTHDSAQQQQHHHQHQPVRKGQPAAGAPYRPKEIARNWQLPAGGHEDVVATVEGRRFTKGRPAGLHAMRPPACRDFLVCAPTLGSKQMPPLAPPPKFCFSKPGQLAGLFLSCLLSRTAHHPRPSHCAPASA